MIEPLTKSNQKMGKISLRSGNGARLAQASRYDAHHTVLSRTYGALAELYFQRFHDGLTTNYSRGVQL